MNDADHLRASLRLQNLIYWAKEKPMAIYCVKYRTYVDDNFDDCGNCAM